VGSPLAREWVLAVRSIRARARSHPTVGKSPRGFVGSPLAGEWVLAARSSALPPEGRQVTGRFCGKPAGGRMGACDEHPFASRLAPTGVRQCFSDTASTLRPPAGFPHRCRVPVGAAIAASSCSCGSGLGRDGCSRQAPIAPKAAPTEKLAAMAATATSTLASAVGRAVGPHPRRDCGGEGFARIRPAGDRPKRSIVFARQVVGARLARDAVGAVRDRACCSSRKDVARRARSYPARVRADGSSRPRKQNAMAKPSRQPDITRRSPPASPRPTTRGIRPVPRRSAP